MTQRFCRMHRRVWTHAPGTGRAAGSPPHTERAGVPTTRARAAAHNVHGDMGEPVTPVTTSRRTTPPSTMWTAAGALSAAPIAPRASDDRNKPGSQIRIPRGDPTSLTATKREPVHPPTYFGEEAIKEVGEQEGYELLAMGKCNCRWWRRVPPVRHTTLPRPPPALLNTPRTA